MSYVVGTVARARCWRRAGAGWCAPLCHSPAPTPATRSAALRQRVLMGCRLAPPGQRLVSVWTCPNAPARNRDASRMLRAPPQKRRRAGDPVPALRPGGSTGSSQPVRRAQDSGSGSAASRTRKAVAAPEIPFKTAGFSYEAKYWMQGHDVVAGAAVAGDRAMAGPVIAAAVVVDKESFHGRPPLEGVCDPAKLDTEQLRWLYEQLVAHPDIRWTVASVSHKSVDHLRIIPAMHLACSDAVDKLEAPEPTWTVTDTPGVPLRLRSRCVAVKNGRASSFSVAAAAIIAAAQHRRVMFQLHRRWPMYGFIKHMGRPTAQHKAALRQHGPCQAHRLMAGLGLYAKIGD